MDPDDDTPDEKRGERIAKWLARAGIASRRDAEKLFAEGQVAVNGRVLDGPANFVQPGDSVTVSGKKVGEPERTRLFRYHKPPGLVTTRTSLPVASSGAATCSSARSGRRCACT